MIAGTPEFWTGPFFNKGSLRFQKFANRACSTTSLWRSSGSPSLATVSQHMRARTAGLDELLRLERYRNDGTREYSEHASYTEAEEAYRPGSSTESFEVEAYELPRERMNVHTADPLSGGVIP